MEPLRLRVSEYCTFCWVKKDLGCILLGMWGHELHFYVCAWLSFFSSWWFDWREVMDWRSWGKGDIFGNLRRETKELHTENCKILMKEMKDNINRLWNIFNIVKMTILPNTAYRFNVIPFKLPMASFKELEQKFSQFVRRHKRPWITKAVLRKNGTERINLPDFRL